MSEKKRIELTRLQGIIAVASFVSGIVIAAVCLFFVPPLGEIASSAISIVSELLVIVERVSTLDTASVLENKYAKSAASVSDGVLHHSLETKPAREPVSVEKQIVYRDSLVYRDRIVTETVEVEKKLSWWQSLKLKVGGLALLAIALLVAYFLITHIINLKFFKL